MSKLLLGLEKGNNIRFEKLNDGGLLVYANNYEYDEFTVLRVLADQKQKLREWLNESTGESEGLCTK
jgi:hypothetical protein